MPPPWQEEEAAAVQSPSHCEQRVAAQAVAEPGGATAADEQMVVEASLLATSSHSPCSPRCRANTVGMHTHTRKAMVSNQRMRHSCVCVSTTLTSMHSMPSAVLFQADTVARAVDT